MYSLELTKPDGRGLTLYGKAPLRCELPPPSPVSAPLDTRPHLRWHPLRGEWITYAAYRQDRTFLPPPEYNPFAVTKDAAHPTELPRGNWDVAVFDNRFPALSLGTGAPPCMLIPTRSAIGKCEVVVFTQDSQSSLARLPLAHIELLFEVWAERTRVLGALPEIQYVLPFENRGGEVGATLHHPHGQIYAYSAVPPIPARMQELAAMHYAQHGTGLLHDLVNKEIEDGRRLIYHGQDAVAFVPACARYPYEAWITPLDPVASFDGLSMRQRADLARALKTLLLKYDGLWDRSFPYVMVWYQAPTDGRSHPEAHLHAEFFPPYRSRDRLKYLAGTELAAGLYAMDALPEEKAVELQRVAVSLHTS